jgi:hypothetical protein
MTFNMPLFDIYAPFTTFVLEGAWPVNSTKFFQGVITVIYVLLVEDILGWCSCSMASLAKEGQGTIPGAGNTFQVPADTVKQYT